MPNFQYTIVDGGGARREGVVTAVDRSAALEALARQGGRPLTIREQAAEKPRPAKTRMGRVPARVMEGFCRELSSLLAAGVPLALALATIGREAGHRSAKPVWEKVHAEVVGGMNLADALGRWPTVFPPVYVAMVRAGETGGFLDVVLEQIADFQARQRDLIGKVKGALIYPAVLGCLAVGVVAFLMFYFIPRFSQIFQDFGAALPTLTRVIIALSQGFTRYGVVLAAVLVVVLVLVRRGLKSDAGRRFRENLMLHLPGVGKVYARFALVRFCRMLGTLLGAGVPLVNSLRVARDAIGNQTLADAVSDALERVRQGQALAGSLRPCRTLFPESVLEVIAVAEESSRLDKELIRLAANSEAELDRQLRVLVALVEPLLLFIMAGIVGTIVLGMLLPVFTLQELIH